jgi:Ca2+-binding RTX toxin-like protein
MPKTLSRLTAAGATLLALAAIAPAAASADASVEFIDHTTYASLLYIVDTGDTTGGLTTVSYDSTTQIYTFHTTLIHIVPGNHCSTVDATTVTCAGTYASAKVNQVYVYDGDGADTVAVAVPSGVKTTVTGGAGNDTLSGGDGTDTILGGDGDDSVAGGNGPDTLTGGGGADKLFGADGADSLSGGGGADTLYGSDGKDSLDGGKSGDKLYGEAGDDTLHGRDGADYLKGGKGADVLHGDGGADELHGNEGKDKIHGDGGDDTLTSKDGTVDEDFCGAGTDSVTKADANDLFSQCESVP